MKNNKILWIFFVIITLYGCEKNNEKSNILIKVKDINFQRPDNVPDFSQVQFFATDTSDILVVNEKRRNSFYLYDINTEELIKSIKFPTGINVSAFYYKNKDSIYISPQYSQNIFIMNDTGEITDTVIYFKDVHKILDVISKYDINMGMEFAYKMNAPMTVEGSKIFVYNFSDPLMQPENQRAFLIIYTDKDSVVINSIPGRTPSDLLRETTTIFPYTAFMSYVRNNKNQTVVNFGPEHKLRIYSDSTLIKTVEPKSKFIKQLPEYIPKEKIDIKHLNERFSNGVFYCGIFYDQFRDLYIRMAKISEILKNGLKDIGYWNYSIMVLDSDFNVISEQEFNGKDYDPTSLLITRNGIILKKHDDFAGITRYSLFEYNEE